MKHDDQLAAEPNPLAFLSGGGEMGNLIRSMDWSATPLGPVEGWPQSLRTTVSICLASDLPICVIWGPGLVQLYNDAYRVICGNKHPRSMGQNFSECWREAWPVIGEAHDSALTGDTAFLESQQIFLERHGYVEECFFTFSFSPIRDEAGRVGGLFHPVIEMTNQMLSERRTRALRDLTAQTNKAKSVSEALCLSSQALSEYVLDVPFVQLYELDPDGDQALVVSATYLEPDPVASLNTTASGVKEQPPWPLEEVVRSGSAVQVHDVRQRIGLASFGPYPEPPDEALALPIVLPGASRPAAVLIAGVSSRLRMTEAYRSFYDMLSAAVTTAVANARAHEDERRRAQALAALDRAKTAFFSNVSHEFRTPLTLMLGPVEDALAAPDEHLPPLQRERLEVVHRNGLRLHRLVNTLLDFSRMEAGRARAAYEPTALSDFTVDLASNFRSACEKAGLELRIDCPPLSEPVFVDNPMWEKIVLNLLSNAFKFTFEGEIAVSMRQVDRAVELRVRDTGTGVPAEEIPRLFERFHRVENARGRTHEGSGIGLALVQELVKLHGGSISADSEVGRGTTFTISIPMGSQHLPHDQVSNRPATAKPTTGANPFVEEALRWLPEADQRSALRSASPSIRDDPTDVTTLAGGPDDERPLVLVADDNADMRQYIVRLLGAQYRTEAVQDGAAGLAAARKRTPDLILTDVLMPMLDGFGLLQALRADPRMSGVPVIMLSARAGEESRIEGLQEGANDYLVKPFSARELLARVAAQLQMTRIRRESIVAIQASEMRYRALVTASDDIVYRMSFDFREVLELVGRNLVADSNVPSTQWMQDYVHPQDRQRVGAAIEAAIANKSIFELEHRVLRPGGELGWARTRAVPLLDEDGAVMEWFGTASDITEARRVQQTLLESEERYRNLFNSMDQGYCILEVIFDDTGKPVDYRFLEVNPGFAKLSGLEDAQGRRIREMAPDMEEHWFTTFGKVALTGEPQRFIHEAESLGNRCFDVYAQNIGGPGSGKVGVLFSNITERRRTEEALRSSEEQFRATFETAAIGIVHIGLDHRWLRVNPAMCSLTGYSAEELTAMAFTELTHPDDLAHNLLQVESLVAGEIDSFKIEKRFIHRSGRHVWVTATASLLRHADGKPRYIIGALEDITEQKATLAQLELQRRFVDRLTHGVPITLHVFGRAERRNLWVNRHLGETLGYSAEDIAQMGADFLRKVLHPGDVAAMELHLDRVFKSADDDVQEVEFRVRDQAGQWRWLRQNDTISRRGPDGLALELVGTATDVTGRKRIAADLTAALAAAEDANRAKSDFLSHMSHELRSPLNAVLGFAQLLQSGTPPPTPRQEECVTEILKAGWYLLGLIEEVLDLSLIESGRLSCVLEPVPLAEVLSDCQALVQGQAAAHGIRLSVAQPGDACIVIVDHTRLKQVFVNLLSNAIKYNREGGSVQVHCEAVEQGRICICIEDSGSGLSPEQLTHIFQPFERLGREAGAIEGTGIGLALSKRLVELMGGRIGVQSTVGQGSVFWVELDTPGAQTSAPASSLETTPAQLRVTAAPGPAAAGRSPRTVLYVEDNSANQLLVQRLLARRTDVRVLLAGDAEHGLLLARTMKPDVVLMDINLPGMSGLQAMEQLAADAATAHIPVIAVSALAMRHDVDKGLQAGFFRYLSKPIKIDALNEALDAALDLAGRREEAQARALVAQPALTASSATSAKNS